VSGAAPVTRPFLSRLLLVLLAACTANGFAQAVELQSRVFEIAGQLRCPVCVSESVADSNAQLAQQMRELIQQQLEEGRSEAEIFAYFTNRYGDWILLDPPKRGVHLLVRGVPGQPRRRGDRRRRSRADGKALAGALARAADGRPGGPRARQSRVESER